MVLKELGVRGTDTTFHHSTKRDRVVFVDDVPPGLVCPACRDAFVCPMIAPCGHSVCKACSEKVNRATGRCFTCDAPANPVDLDDDGVSAVELGDVGRSVTNTDAAFSVGLVVALFYIAQAVVPPSRRV